MKKTILSLLVVGILTILPQGVFAQMASVSATQAQHDQMLRQLIGLLYQQVQALQAKLADLAAKQSATHVPAGSSTVVVASPTQSSSTALEFSFPTLSGCYPVSTDKFSVSVPYYQFSPLTGQQKLYRLETSAYVPYYLQNIYDYNSPTKYWLEYGTAADALSSTSSVQTISTNWTNGAHYFESQFTLQNIIETTPYYYRMVFQNANGVQRSPATDTAPCSFTAPLRPAQ